MVVVDVVVVEELGAGAMRLVQVVCVEKATAQQVHELFQGDKGPLMRACINVVVQWDDGTGSVLLHAAGTDGVGSEVVKVLLDEGEGEVDGRDGGKRTPLMVVAYRGDEEAGVEVARGEFVLWWFCLHCSHPLSLLYSILYSSVFA